MSTHTTPQQPPGAPQQDAAAPPPEPGRSRAEITTKTVQVVLLGLGGLLLATALVVFTAVAWRQLGDGARLTILAGFTSLLLAVPLALTRFRLWATAETIAATATLAMWCSALAGYYLHLPGGASLTAPSVAAWTTLVLMAATVYRLVSRLSAPAWALLPLAATGAVFAAVGDAVDAAIHMTIIGGVLAGAAWTIRLRPTLRVRSDQWAARALLCAAIVTVFLAGLRVAFGLEATVLPLVAAATCLLASIGTLVCAHAHREGASRATVAVAASAAGTLAVAAWVLAIRSADPLLAVPGFALLGVVIVVLAAWTDPNGPDWLPSGAAAAGAIASLGTLGAVLTDGFELTAYLGAALLAVAVSPIFPAPLRTALRHGATVAGAGVLTWCVGIAVSAVPVAYGATANPLLRWEVPAVALACALGAPLVARRWRPDFLAAVAAVAALPAGALSQGPWAASAAFALVLAALLTVAFGSRDMTVRGLSWIAVFPWLGATAAAAPTVDLGAFGSGMYGLPLATAGASLLAAVYAAPGRGGFDRTVARVWGNAAVSAYLVWMLIGSWASAGWDGEATSLAAPLGLVAYSAALAVAAWTSPAHRVRYVLASTTVATAAHLALAGRESVSVMEWYTVPPALALLAIGAWLLRRDPRIGSWAAMAPALALGLAPSLAVSFGPDGEPLRRVLVGAAALAVLLLAAWRRWQAPILVGALVLAALSVNETVLLWSRVPKWIPLAIGGAVLIAAGATLEQRRRDLARLSGSVRSMR